MTIAAVAPATSLRGVLRMPSDKSIAHRALLANAFADGRATIRLRVPGADVESTMRCLHRLGAKLEVRRQEEAVEISVEGGHGPVTPAEPLDCGNSGTTMRLLAGVLAGQPVGALLEGDASLRRRPMERLAAPLRAMGASVQTTGGCAPLDIRGRPPLRALVHELDVASAQLVGAIAFAGLAAEGETVVTTPAQTRDHTERLLGWMGAKIVRDGRTTTVRGPARLECRSLEVPGDPSSAAAWLVAGSLHPDAELRIEGVCINPTRLAFVQALTEMGASIAVLKRRSTGPEPMGDLAVHSAGRLRPLRIAGTQVAQLIDELPVLAIAMAAADGVSELRDAAELRVKESDRITTVVAGLAAMGIGVEELPDGWRIAGGRTRAREVEVVTSGDHRVAISFAVAGLCGLAPLVVLDDAACASVSYPTFWSDLERVSGRPLGVAARA